MTVREWVSFVICCCQSSGAGEGEGMGKVRHLLSSIQVRRGVRAREWVNFVICGRRSIGGRE